MRCTCSSEHLHRRLRTNMLCLSVLTFTMAALVSAAPPPKKDKNQFTIRPITQQDKCLDVEPASGETVGYALV